MQEFEGNIIYCQNCGEANSKDSAFCSKCGTRLVYSQAEQKPAQTPENTPWTVNTSNDEMDRDFTIANLQDLHNLYFASKNFEENINKLYEKKNQLGKKQTITKPIEPIKPSVNIGDYVGVFIFWAIITIILLPLLPIWLIIAIVCIKSEKEDYKKKLEVEYPQKLKEYNEAMEKYYQDLKAAEEQYDREVNIGIPNLDKAIVDLDKERNEALKLIDECYDVNIIPSKYRNIYAIRFIYDYMTTSNGTLRDALFACDLDKIQAQLEKVIQNQGSMICKLAKIEANSEKQIQQQERMMNHLKNIETNTYDTARATELSARYNRIIAHNTNVMAYCSAMTYIDNRDIDDFNYYSPQTIKDFGLERFAQYYEK